MVPKQIFLKFSFHSAGNIIFLFYFRMKQIWLCPRFPQNDNFIFSLSVEPHIRLCCAPLECASPPEPSVTFQIY